MNNDQFRNFLLENARAKSPGTGNRGSPTTEVRAGRGTPALLGSRQKSSIPMTPRSVAGTTDFSRQLSERNLPNQAQNKFRTSVPKGTKVAEGYVDRSKTREQEAEDERARRLQTLEESMKNGEIEHKTYEKLRSEIAGGDMSTTHLIKGLDFKLLERIRKGENVYKELSRSLSKSLSPDAEEERHEAEPKKDADELLDELETHEVKPIEKEKVQKKGQFAPASLAPGQKRTRNQILAELKAARQAAKEAKEESALGFRFKKIGARPMPSTRIERDSKGREVMIIVDEDGNERRKVRKLGGFASNASEKDKLKPDKNGEVLGMEVPVYYREQQLAKAKEEEEKEATIFDDESSDYDPLSGLKGSSDEELEKDKPETKQGLASGEETAKAKAEKEAIPPPPGQEPPPAARNYFKDSKTALTSAEPPKIPALSDPMILAAIKKVKESESKRRSEEEIKAAEREARLKRLLESSSRDDADLDVGFGTNRLEDEADLEETKVKLSAWEDESDEGGTVGGKPKRKRGPKKRKGDKNSFADVMRVLESRKSSGS
ncbi:hypothetical protein VTK73DRAFT_3268 [Phialemonium thermophilum]|uniref:RED-like N-terminal domain-containing protein n=1 Tax=Phialemonium thermophilum TaxID=223376 RepID=A0ABR3Y9Z4_9PEZI